MVSDETSLVCLVGENGSGKSAVLEMLSACAHLLGIAQGVETSRGNPLDEVHDLEIVARVPVADLLDQGLTQQLDEG